MQLFFEIAIPFLVAASVWIVHRFATSDSRRNGSSRYELGKFVTVDDLERGARKIAASIGATELAIFAIQPTSRRGQPELVLHLRGGGPIDEKVRQAAVAAFAQIIQPCLKLSRDGAIELPGPQDPSGNQFCLVTLARQRKLVHCAIAFITRQRDLDEARTTLARVQIAASGN